jgi:hypothetical protein
MCLFEKLDKNIEIGNNEWHGAPFGEIETEPRNLAVFVNKINNLATQSWKQNSGLCFIEKKSGLNWVNPEIGWKGMLD